ncbi:MAG: hypothetical protein AB1714_20925 [Acidobacteriota bacterium]
MKTTHGTVAEPRRQRVNRDKVKQILAEAFPKALPPDEALVDISDGYKDNIHVMVISRQFDKIKNERAKQELLWAIIDRAGLDDEEKLLISLVLPVSPAEIK